MNTSNFLTCLGYFGVSTGTSAYLEGAYSPSSGTTGYLFNQLYPTGLHQSGSLIYGPVLPLINVGVQNVTSTLFTGSQALRVGYQHSGNFSVLMDIEYSGCNRGPNIGKYNVLLSTVDNPSGLVSGFSISINDSNRLSFKTLNRGYTLSKELTTHDMVYVSLTENQYVTMGIYSIKEGVFYSKNIALDNQNLNSNSIYFGGHLNNGGIYTGFSGRLNNIFLFSDDLNDIDVGTCSMCSLVTGYSRVSVTNSFSGYQITGLYYSGVQTTGFTGYSLITGQVRKADGSYIPVLINSGISGYLTTGEVATPLLGNVTIQTSGDSWSFFYDQAALNSFLTSSVEFDNSLTSGDVVEIYTYQYPNPKVGKLVSGTNWPIATGGDFIQLISNGLNETSGIDFQVNHNVIDGFYDTDVLSYDIATGPAIVTAYSGYWTDGKIQMVSGYYPPTSQYPESAGIVYLSGVNGVTVDNIYSPQFGYDLWLNGQKLISGVHYDVVTGRVVSTTTLEPILDFWGNPIEDEWGDYLYAYAVQTGFNVRLSGQSLPLLLVEPLYHPTGGLPTGIKSVEDSELTFLPIWSGFNRSLLQITGDVKSIGNITGFSEQIWVNGLRQVVQDDYVFHYPCDEIPKILTPPNTPYSIFNSQNGEPNKFDFPLFPNFTDLYLESEYDAGDNTLLNIGVYWNYSLANNAYDESLPTAEIWLDTNYYSMNLGRIHGGIWDGYDSFFGLPAYDSFHFSVKMRYASGNSYGPWSAPSNENILSY